MLSKLIIKQFNHAVSYGVILTSLFLVNSANAAQKNEVPGYSDTPIIPGTQWHVHDPKRPQPEVVVTNSAVVQQPPSDAIVLFDGSSMEMFERTKGKEPVEWLLEDGIVTIQHDPTTGKYQSIRTKELFGDMQLHIEWRSPAELDFWPPSRGNSGLFFMGRYEFQVLQSHNNPIYPDGQAGAIYGQTPPLVNASQPAGEWQSYDIVFEAPEFDKNGNLVEPAYITAFHNGVLIQLRTPIQGPTRHKKTTSYKAHRVTDSLVFQDHGSAVSFRNIWARKLDLSRR